jgi:hypothetical protein
MHLVCFEVFHPSFATANFLLADKRSRLELLIRNKTGTEWLTTCGRGFSKRDPSCDYSH